MKYTITYDTENDALFILSSKLDYYGEETGDFVEIKNKITNKTLGYTIRNFSKHKADIKDMPWGSCNFKKDIKPYIERID